MIVPTITHPYHQALFIDLKYSHSIINFIVIIFVYPHKPTN